MKRTMYEKMEKIDSLAKLDVPYLKLWEEYVMLEKAFFRVLKDLPDEQRDVISDFVMCCESVSLRKLELACEHIVFADR